MDVPQKTPTQYARMRAQFKQRERQSREDEEEKQRTIDRSYSNDPYCHRCGYFCVPVSGSSPLKMMCTKCFTIQ